MRRMRLLRNRRRRLRKIVKMPIKRHQQMKPRKQAKNPQALLLRLSQQLQRSAIKKKNTLMAMVLMVMMEVTVKMVKMVVMDMMVLD